MAENKMTLALIICSITFIKIISKVDGYSGQLYYYPNNTKTFDQAKAQCEGQGLSMVKIEDLAELNRVETFVRKNSGPVNDMWIGAYYDVINSEHRWLDGEVLTWGKWSSGEPNGLTSSTDPEHCVRISKSFLFKSRQCHFKFDVICERVQRRFHLWPGFASKEVVTGLVAGFGSFFLLAAFLSICWRCGFCGRQQDDDNDKLTNDEFEFDKPTPWATTVQMNEPGDMKYQYYNDKTTHYNI